MVTPTGAQSPVVLGCCVYGQQMDWWGLGHPSDATALLHPLNECVSWTHTCFRPCTVMHRAQQEQPQELPGAKGQAGWRKELTLLTCRPALGWIEDPGAIVVVTKRYGLPVRRAALSAPPAQHRLSHGSTRAALGPV